MGSTLVSRNWFAGVFAGKLTDTLSSLGLIEIGARLYSTVLGRFLQVGPVPGGGVNAYSYPPDPVNMNDYSGKVGTAESYSTWGQHNASPTKDGNLRANRNKGIHPAKKIHSRGNFKIKFHNTSVIGLGILGGALLVGSYLTGLGELATAGALVGLTATYLICRAIVDASCVGSIALAAGGIALKTGQVLRLVGDETSRWGIQLLDGLGLAYIGYD